MDFRNKRQDNTPKKNQKKQKSKKNKNSFLFDTTK